MLGTALLYFLLALLMLTLAAHTFSPLKEPNKFAAGIYTVGTMVNLGFCLLWVVRYFSLN